MTDLIDISNFRFYFGQASGTQGTEYVYDSAFDTYKHDATEDIQKWDLQKRNERGDELNFTLSNPSGRYKDLYPIQFGYGVEVKYITDSTVVEEADAITNWSEAGAGYTGPLLESDNLKSGVGAIKFNIANDITGSDWVAITNISQVLAIGDEIELWMRSTQSLDAGDIDLKLYSAGPTPEDTLTNINAIAATTWTRVRFGAVTAAHTMIEMRIQPDAGTLLFGAGSEAVWFDEVLAITEVKWVFKGSMNPIDLTSAPTRNTINIITYSVGHWADSIIISRDYYKETWHYIEDVVWDIIYNLSSLYSKQGVDLYVPVIGTDTLMNDKGDIAGGNKHVTNMDFRLRDISPDNAINQLCTAARIGYYFHTDATTGGLRLTLKDRDLTDEDYTIEGADWEIGEIVRKRYNDNMAAKVVVNGKDGVSASQVNRGAVNIGHTKVNIVSDTSLETPAECAERAHLEILKDSPSDEIITITNSPANAAFGHDYLFIQPYDVIDITDADVGLDNDNFNVIDQEIQVDASIGIKWTLGAVYKKQWLRFYEFVKSQDKETVVDTIPTHHRATSAAVTITYDYFVMDVGTLADATTTDIGKQEIANCFTSAFFPDRNMAQRFMRAYVADSSGLLDDLATLHDGIFFSCDDTLGSEKVRLYLPFKWINGMGGDKTIEHLYVVVDEVTELMSELTKGGSSVEMKSAANGANKKYFYIEYRNSAKVNWSDGSSEFSVLVDDFDIFQDTDDLEVLYADGTSGTFTNITVDEDAHIISGTGTVPTVGSTVYYDGTEEMRVSSVAYDTTFDTVSCSDTASRTIQAGAKIIKRFSYATENLIDMAYIVPGVGTEAVRTGIIYLVLTFTPDQSYTDHNKAGLTKAGCLFFGTQLIGDPGTDTRRVYRTDNLYAAIGDDNTTDIDFDWFSDDVLIELDGIWDGNTDTFTIKTGSSTVDTLTTTRSKSSFVAATADMNGDGTNEATGYWDGYVLEFTSVGDNNGVTRIISTWNVDKTITLNAPLPHYPGNGDTFTVEPPITVGDYIFYASTGTYPMKFTGVSGGDEQRANFLKITDFTGGDTIVVEGLHALGTSIPDDEQLYLVARESLASELCRVLSDALVVTPGYENGRYTLKFVSEFKDNQVGESTDDTTGVYDGEYAEIAEVGIFTRPAVSGSTIQYYLDNVRTDESITGMGYGDDCYDNLTGRSLKENDLNLPRSDSFGNAYNILSVKGAKGITTSVLPSLICLGKMSDTLDIYRSYDVVPESEQRWVRGEALKGVRDKLPQTSWIYERGYNIRIPGPFGWTINRPDDFTGIGNPNIVASHGDDGEWTVHLLVFDIPRTFDRSKLKGIRFRWGGISNRPIRCYVHINADQTGTKDRWNRIDFWAELGLTSYSGIKSYDLPSADSTDERYYYGSARYEQEPWRLVTPNQQIMVAITAGDSSASYQPFLFTDIATMEFVGETTNFQQSKGVFKKGIDYYYSRTSPEYIWWDFVDPLEYAGYIERRLGDQNDGLVRLIPSNFTPFSVGSKIYIKDDNDKWVSTVIIEMGYKVAGEFVPGRTYLGIEKASLKLSEITGNNEIYIVGRPKSVMVDGIEYMKEVPSKVLMSSTFDNINAADVIVWEGFEQGQKPIGGGSYPITTDNTILSAISGTPKFTDDPLFEGDISGLVLLSGDLVEIETDDTEVNYLGASVDIKIWESTSTADVYIELQNSGGTIQGGVRFQDDGVDERVYYYHNASWYYSDGTDGFDFNWAYDTPYRVELLYDVANSRYTVSINGIAITLGSNSNDELYFIGGISRPVKLEVRNSSGSDTCVIDNMTLGSGPCSEVMFVDEFAAGIGNPHRKRGYMQYAPSEVSFDGTGDDPDLSSLAEYSSGDIILGAVLENVEDGRVCISKFDVPVFSTKIVKDTVTNEVVDPLLLTLADASSKLSITADVVSMSLKAGATSLGDEYYGNAPPASYGVQNATTLLNSRCYRFCHFRLYHAGSAGVNTVVELWSRRGTNKFGYLSGYSYIEGNLDKTEILIDAGSGNFMEQATVGCLNLYRQDLTSPTRNAEVWDTLPLYDIKVGDDFFILDEPYQPDAGIARFQPGMQIGFSKHTTPGNPDPLPVTQQGSTGDVEHFIIRSVSPWPRSTVESFSGVSHTPGFANGDNIVSDWVWEVSEVAPGIVDTYTDSGYGNAGRVLLNVGPTGTAAITHTTHIETLQTVRVVLTGQTTAYGYIALKNAAGTTMVDIDFNNGTIRDGSDTTITSFPDSTTNIQLDIDIDYGGTEPGLYQVHYKHLGTTTSGTHSWVDFDNSAADNRITDIVIGATNSAGGTALYITRVEILGGDRSDPRLYVEITHDTAAYARFQVAYDVSDVNFRLWKWMEERASFQPIWVNPYHGLKPNDKASIDMFYEHGANYTVDYLEPNGACLLRGLLQDSSSDQPIQVYPGEKVVVTQEIEFDF